MEDYCDILTIPKDVALVRDGEYQVNEQSQKLLYMDAANYCFQKFFGGGGGVKQKWNLARAKQNVQRFANAAEACGWKVVAFLDQAAMTKEAQNKWRKRREKEVRDGKREVPMGALRLLGDMFVKHGVEVKYSLEADCDDTIAFHAQAHGASVLSQDKDFLRYKGATFPLFKNYFIHKGKLSLIKQDQVTNKVSWRDLGPPPATGNFNPFRDCVEGHTYLRGAPSPLSDLGNLHITVRPLRQALYSRLGITNPVKEELPIRVGTTCVWDKQMVPPNDGMRGFLLDEAAAAVSYFEQERPGGVSDDDWFKHQFALRSLVAELCCTAQDRTLFEVLEPLIATIDNSPEERRQRNQATKTVGNDSGRYPTRRNQPAGGSKGPPPSSPTAPQKLQRTTNPKKNPPEKARENHIAEQRKASAHYKEWRSQQKTGESNKEKREQYLKLFPNHNI